MNQPNKRVPFTSSQSLFTFFFLFFFFTLLNGYLQNLVADYRADASLVLIGGGVEMAIVFWLARRFIAIQFDPLETAGFVLVTLGVWWYFVYAALPTLLPPTQSSDAVRVYQQVMFSYPRANSSVGIRRAARSLPRCSRAGWIGRRCASCIRSPRVSSR